MRRSFGVAGLLAVCALGSAPALEAAPILSIRTFDAGFTLLDSQLVADGGLGDSNPLPNEIAHVVFLPIGGVDFSIVAGTSNSPALGGGGQLQTTSLDFNNLSGANRIVQVSFTDTGFVAAPKTYDLSGSLGVVSIDSDVGVAYRSSVGYNNVPFGSSVSTASVCVNDASGLTDDCSATAVATTFDPILGVYSLTGTLSLFLAPGATGTLSAVTASAPIPEPASMLLLGSGLAGLAAARRRGRKHTGR